MSSNQIKILDHRNAIYQGQEESDLYDGIGISLTQDFLFNASIWKKGVLHGATFTIFPSQKILYGDFQNNTPAGIFCYELSKQCQFYFLFNANKMQKLIVAIFPYLQIVLEVLLSNIDTIEYQKQHPYTTPQQKWNIVSQLLNYKIPQFMKGYRRFIKNSFLDYFNEQVQEINGEEYYFGVIGEGLGVKMDMRDVCVQSIGYYDRDKVLLHIGNRLISKEKKVREQGIFSKPETLYRYQQTRENKNKKFYRDYFRLGIDFKNKFLQFPRLQQIQKQILTFRDTLKNNTTRKIAQQLIQHLDEFQLNDEQPPKVSNSNNRNRYEPSKMMKDVGIQDLKQELNRSMSNNKNRGKSPYKEYDPTPAEMKYVNRNNQKVEDVRNRSYDKKKDNGNQDAHYERDRFQGRYGDHQYTNYTNKYGDRNSGSKQRYDNRQTSPYNTNNVHNDSFNDQKSKHRQAIRKINYDYENQHRVNLRRHQQIQKKQKRYPIQQNLRPYQRINNTSKSPIKTYKYVEDNPQIDYTYKPINPVNRPKQQPIRNVSPFTLAENEKKQRKVTPTRTDRLSQLYDQYQSKTNQDKSFNSPERKYNLNHGKGYHFNENQFEKQVGMVRTGRKIETPKRTISPNRLESKYGASTNDRNYDRDRYVDERQGDKDRKSYHYFNRNR